MPSTFFFFNDTATTEIYTLSLHDALPISRRLFGVAFGGALALGALSFMTAVGWAGATLDRKSTRLNSSHSQISYAVFCLKKKKKNQTLSCDSNRTTLSLLLTHVSVNIV